jgi:hypothetical protein
MDAFDIRSVDGRSFGAAGPSAAWFRLLAPVFAGEPITPLDRVLAMADFGNGHQQHHRDGTTSLHQP